MSPKTICSLLIYTQPLETVFSTFSENSCFSVAPSITPFFTISSFLERKHIQCCTQTNRKGGGGENLLLSIFETHLAKQNVLFAIFRDLRMEMASDLETRVCLLSSGNRTPWVRSRQSWENVLCCQSFISSLSRAGFHLLIHITTSLGPCATLLEFLPLLAPFYPSDHHIDNLYPAVFFLIRQGLG